MSPLGNISAIENEAGIVTLRALKRMARDVDQINDTFAQVVRNASIVASHLDLRDIGVNSHLQIDSHISNTTNPHTVTLEQVIAASATATSVPIFDGGLDLNDNDKIRLGTGKDAEIYYDGTDLIVDPAAVGSGRLFVTGEVHLERPAVTAPALTVQGSLGETDPMIEFKDFAGDIGAVIDQDGYMATEDPASQPLTFRSHAVDPGLPDPDIGAFVFGGDTGATHTDWFAVQADSTTIWHLDNTGQAYFGAGVNDQYIHESLTFTHGNLGTTTGPLANFEAAIGINRTGTTPSAYIRMDTMTPAEVITAGGQPTGVNWYRTLFADSSAETLKVMNETAGTWTLEANIFVQNSGSGSLPQQPISEVGDGLIASDNPGNTSTLMQLDEGYDPTWTGTHDFQGTVKIDAIIPSLGSSVAIDDLEIDRDTTLGAAPSFPKFKSLNRQGSAKGDQVYISVQKADTTWAWLYLGGLP